LHVLITHRLGYIDLHTLLSLENLSHSIRSFITFDDDYWKNKCKACWKENLKDYHVEERCLDVLFERVHCPLDEKVPLFSENICDFRNRTNPNSGKKRITTAQRQAMKQYLTGPIQTESYDQFWERISGSLGESPREPRRTWKALLLSEANIAKYGAVHFTLSPVYSHHTNVNQSLIESPVNIDTYLERSNTTARFLPLGHRFFTLREQGEEGKVDTIFVNATSYGTWTVASSTEGAPILVYWVWRRVLHRSYYQFDDGTQHETDWLAGEWMFPPIKLREKKRKAN